MARARPRVRIVFDNGVRIGPGKIDLLEAIATTGSIAAAGRSLGMSYRRAWILVDEIGHVFARPVVITSTGGARGGGARLTEFGLALVHAYRRVEQRTQRAMCEEFASFEEALSLRPAERSTEATDG